MAAMTMRERMLAVVQGREHDRVPFVQYSGLAAPNEEIWAVIGRNNMGLLQWCHPHQVEFPHCRFESTQFERDGKQVDRTVLHTPEGTLTQEKFLEPAYGSAATHQHFIREPEDYKILMAYYRDATVRKNFDPVRDVIRDLGDDGLPHVSVERTPFQKLWVEWVSIEDLSLHLVDCPELMDEVVALLVGVEEQIFQVACEAVQELPIPYLDVPDNLTAPIIGERYFRKYCLPSYRKLAEMLAETGRDVPVYVHADGDLKPLWAAIGESEVRGLESLSPPPDNDTCVAAAMGLWPDMRIAVNFPSSVHLAEPERVYAVAEQILAEGGPTGRLQIQVSESVPAGRWKVSYPEIVKAIDAFGQPGR